MLFLCVFFCAQIINAQRGAIEDIVKRDTLNIFNLEHKSSLILNDFKYKKGDLVFIFSKNEILKNLKNEIKESIKQMDDDQIKEFREERLFLEKFIQKN